LLLPTAPRYHPGVLHAVWLRTLGGLVMSLILETARAGDNLKKRGRTFPMTVGSGETFHSSCRSALRRLRPTVKSMIDPVRGIARLQKPDYQRIKTATASDLHEHFPEPTRTLIRVGLARAVPAVLRTIGHRRSPSNQRNQLELTLFPSPAPFQWMMTLFLFSAEVLTMPNEVLETYDVTCDELADDLERVHKMICKSVRPDPLGSPRPGLVLTPLLPVPHPPSTPQCASPTSCAL
jgi:hypothetical protein